MRIFYIGPLHQGSTCLHRYQAMVSMGHLVFAFDIEHYFPTNYRGIHTIVRKLQFGPRLWKMNRDIKTAVAAFKPSLIWIDKGLQIDPTMLGGIKQGPIPPLFVHFSPDDMMNPDNQSRFYLRSIPLYDIHITTKTVNVDELKQLGARRVYLMGNTYCASAHRPIQVSREDREIYGGEIGFVGCYEKERAMSIRHIAQSGMRVRVWGHCWGGMPAEKNVLIENRSLWGEEYPRAICATDINLCFLRKVNRDQQTSRSVEIPACGAFMIAERTKEHLALFKEDQEAVFFSSDSELIDKLKYYIAHPEERLAIASAGRNRCVKSGYSNVDRLKAFFRELDS